MKINKAFLLFVTVQSIVIILGGYLYSLIPLVDNTDLIICINNNNNNNNNASNSSQNCNINDQTPSLSEGVFFVITTITTIGYGQLTPKTDLGKVFTILVAFIGIPINIVFLAKIGELLKNVSSKILKPIEKYAKSKKKIIIIQVCICIFINHTFMSSIQSF